ncbi:FAD-dependent oxidoreductase [Nocardia sp. NBC_01503]|uniref:NAD(P)/FAD-dependent oxidoreductase n=1 Tax=Nocardia sp. NBC_01503 TaxID=2975997 RepID=UPI002E7B6502|nr:FAD-dependent oxidoreductase [Nocardia sp. NBC_01503]WTL31327.1 FAD-dependent oxidoreductase [Nocardia sp. NBC_01503]
MTRDRQDPMLADPDVVVIGGGVVGLCCAHQLRQRGATVTVLERGALGGPQSCSYGNTGFVGTHGAAPLAEPGMRALAVPGATEPDSPWYIEPRADAELTRWLEHFRRACSVEAAAAGFRTLIGMKRRSLQILLELCATESIAATLESPGIVLAFKTAAGFDDARRGVERTVAAGVPLRVLGPGELGELEPKTVFDIHGALYNPEGAYLHVPDFIVEFGRVLSDSGVDIREHTEVAGFEVRERNIVRLNTTRGELRPGNVVIAAGAWSAACAHMAGVDLLLQSIKGHSVTVAMPPSAPCRPVLLSEGKLAMVPLGDRLRIGGQLEMTGMSTEVSERRIRALLRTVREFLPALEETPTLHTWSGLRPCTPDSLPLIGAAGDLGNLLIAAGHGHIGMGLAPASGELIAQLLAGEQPQTDPIPLRPNRFGGAVT